MFDPMFNEGPVDPARVMPTPFSQLLCAAVLDVLYPVEGVVAVDPLTGDVVALDVRDPMVN